MADESSDELLKRRIEALKKWGINLGFALVIALALFGLNWLSVRTGIVVTPPAVMVENTGPTPVVNVTNEVHPSPLFGALAPQPMPVVAADPPPGPQGWVDKPDEVKAIQATLPFPVFATTPAGTTAEDLPKFSYLWDGYRKQYGRPPPAQDQNPIGSCVSFGTSRAMERSLINQVVNGERYEFQPFTEEVIYALSRVNIGRGQLRGQDGSVGAWAAKAATEFGGLPRGTYGAHKLTTYDPTRCRQWGDSGIPADLLAEVKKYPVGSTTLVRTWPEAKKAIAQRYGIAVCSNQGFTSRRDANGVCQPSGNWNHCMVLDGYHTDESGKEWGHIENSWGPNYHTGPVGWGEPNTAGFWTDSATINRMLGQGDSWAFSAVAGFPRKKINWFADARTTQQLLNLSTDREPVYTLAP